MIYNAYQGTCDGIAGVSVVSSGHIFAKKGRSIDRPSGRPDYLLFYVIKGKEHFFLDGEAVAEEGSFILFRPREKQKHVYKEDRPGEFYYVHFNAPADFDLFGFKSSFIYHSKPSAAVCGVFEEIIGELQKKQPAYEKICASKLFLLLSVLERKEKTESTVNSVHFDKISFVIQKMNREYQIGHTLDDYAKMCGLSKYHFLRVFRETTGVSPIEYRNEIRIGHVKELLKDTGVPISEIAEKAGFASPSYFCTAFKKKTGVSPTEYRNSEM